MPANLHGGDLTVAEAALVRVNPSTAHYWLAHGRLPAYRLGWPRVAHKRADLATAIASSGSGPGADDDAHHPALARQ